MTLVNDMILESLREKRLIIYGTGHVAHKFYKALQNRSLQENIQCFVRSGTVNVGELFEGMPVYDFKEVHIEEDNLICLAVHESLLGEIEEAVRQVTEQYLWIYPYLYELMLGGPVQTDVELDIKLLLKSFRHDLRLGVRIAAIEQRFEINTYGFDYYIRGQMLHCSKDTAVQRLNRFLELIDRWKKSGYERRYVVSVNQNDEVIDGNHRLAMAVYTGQLTIFGNIYPTKLSAGEIHGQAAMLSEELLTEHGFTVCEIQRLKTIQQRYLKAYGIE